MIYRYFSILFAVALVVAGLQVPGFIVQYEQRVGAHLAEVRKNLEGFQRIADQYHNGSLSALIEKHRISADTTFRAEGDVIADMVARLERFTAELDSLNTDLAGRITHLATGADKELFDETIAEYAFVITLNTDAAMCGGIALIIGVVLLDLLRLLILTLFGRGTRKTVW